MKFDANGWKRPAGEVLKTSWAKKKSVKVAYHSPNNY